jgi:hypothetical protein
VPQVSLLRPGYPIAKKIIKFRILAPEPFKTPANPHVNPRNQLTLSIQMKYRWRKHPLPIPYNIKKPENGGKYPIANNPFVLGNML